MRLSLWFPGALLLVACSAAKLEVSPSELPDGTVGQQFEALIKVTNNIPHSAVPTSSAATYRRV